MVKCRFSNARYEVVQAVIAFDSIKLINKLMMSRLSNARHEVEEGDFA